MNTVGKYVAGGLLLGSVLALVLLGKAETQAYLELVTAALGGLGVHVAMSGNGPKAS